MSLGVNFDILAGVSPRPKNVVLKAMGSIGNGGVCNASTVNSGGDNLATGMEIWQGARASQPEGQPVTAAIPGTLSPFTPSTLSAAELVKLNTGCAALPVRACAASVCQ